MKTEFLKNLGLEQDAIDKIMAENGKDIAAEQAKTAKAESERDNYKDQFETVNGKLKEFEGVNVSDMREQIEQLQKDLKAKDDAYAAKEADRVFNETLSEAIKSAGGRNEKAVKGLLDIDALKGSKDQSADIKKALDAVKESDAYLFTADEPFMNPVGPTNNGDEGKRVGGLASIRAAMGLPAKKGE